MGLDDRVGNPCLSDDHVFANTLAQLHGSITATEARD